MNPFADVTGSWTVLNVPKILYHCQLNNYDWARHPKAVQPVLDFMQATVEGTPAKLLLIGQTGLGKSHIGVGLYRWGVIRWDTMDCMFLNVPDFCDRIKQRYGDDAGDPYAELRQARRLVVIDDVFGRELSAHELAQIVPRIIEITYSNAAAVVVTMNFTTKEAGTYLAPHELDRLTSGDPVIIEFSGVSYRLPQDPAQQTLNL